MDDSQRGVDDSQRGMDDSQRGVDDSQRGMDEQREVAAFVDRHDLAAPPEFRLLDLVSEVGELAKDAAESTGYGEDPEAIAVNSDEIGDVLFAVLALANSLDVDAGDALDEALEKYSERMKTDETPSSGN